jgi:hypothetical protein
MQSSTPYAVFYYSCMQVYLNYPGVAVGCHRLTGDPKDQLRAASSRVHKASGVSLSVTFRYSHPWFVEQNHTSTTLLTSKLHIRVLVLVYG